MGREELDITNKQSVYEKIKELQPGVVINATGYTNVDGAETEKKTAFAVNAEGVGYIAEICARINAVLFHFSTDYIFDGREPQGYREDDTEHIGPLNVYGESKRAGELRITNKEWQYFIIRTSWLYGSGGKNFVDTMLARAKEGQTEFKVVDDQFGKPTYTEDLAERVVWMVEHMNKLKAGVYHCANEVANCELRITNDKAANGISWYEFACEIFKQAHSVGILKFVPKLTPCATSEFPRPAARPRYSALINTKLPLMRDWKEAIGEYMGKIITRG